MSGEQVEEKSEFRRLLEFVPHVVAAASTAVFFASFLYEFGYFFVLGRPLQSLLSATDYVVGAISWLPHAAFFFFVGYSTSLLIKRLEGFVPEAERRKRYASKMQAFLLNDSPFVLTGVMFVLFVPYIVFFLDPYFLTIFGTGSFFFIWLIIVVWFLRHERFQGIITMPIVYLCILVPIFGVVALGRGALTGYQALIRISDVYVVRLKDEEADRNVQLLRVLSAGVLLHDPVKARILFEKWDAIRTFAVRAPPLDVRPLFCQWTGYFCPPGPSRHE